MVDVNLLKSYFVRHGYTQEDIAKALDMNPKTLRSRMTRGVFGSDEIMKLVDLLKIEDPMRVFFNS